MAARFAAGQHGLVTRAQLLGAGVSDDQIQYRVRIERFHRLYPGVFSLGGAELDRFGRWLAAVLACGEGAVLSHRSAAALWGLLAEPRGPAHVTVPGRWNSRRHGIVVHATRSLPAAETRRVRRIPATSVERTLIDIAADPEIERAVEQAYALKLIGRTRIKEALARASGRKGTKELNLLIARCSSDLPMTRSELERRFLALVRTRRAAEPDRQPPPSHPPRRLRLARARPGRGNRRPRHPRQPLRLSPRPRPRSRPRVRRPARDPPVLVAGRDEPGRIATLLRRRLSTAQRLPASPPDPGPTRPGT